MILYIKSHIPSQFDELFINDSDRFISKYLFKENSIFYCQNLLPSWGEPISQHRLLCSPFKAVHYIFRGQGLNICEGARGIGLGP
jgi:hypothetical protein